jgi:hypothetical protein
MLRGWPPVCQIQGDKQEEGWPDDADNVVAWHGLLIGMVRLGFRSAGPTMSPSSEVRGRLPVAVRGRLPEVSTLSHPFYHVACNSARVFIGASPMIFQGMFDPEVMEATTCSEGMAMSSDLDLQRVKLVSDCVNATQRIQSGDTLRSYDQIVHEMRVLASNSQSFDFAHENRCSNGDAIP